MGTASLCGSAAGCLGEAVHAPCVCVEGAYEWLFVSDAWNVHIINGNRTGGTSHPWKSACQVALPPKATNLLDFCQKQSSSPVRLGINRGRTDLIQTGSHKDDFVKLLAL